MNTLTGIATNKIPIRRIFYKSFLAKAKNDLLSTSLRRLFLKMSGVKIKGNCFIGSRIEIDSIRPDLISIGNNCTITHGVCIITHFYSPKDKTYYFGNVNIGNNVFIGMNTVIINPINIGDNAVIGAGSIITKDIPANEIWAGNPAKFIRKIE